MVTNTSTALPQVRDSVAARAVAIVMTAMLGLTLIGGVGLNVTFMSYGKDVDMGFTANGAALPEVETLARYVQDAFVALRK